MSEFQVQNHQGGCSRRKFAIFEEVSRPVEAVVALVLSILATSDHGRLEDRHIRQTEITRKHLGRAAGV